MSSHHSEKCYQSDRHNVRLMASPKVSLQQRCYQGRWNMRLPSDGVIPMKKPQHQKAQICDVCSGMYKHGMFAPKKAEGLGCPPITQKNVNNQI